LKGCRLCLRGKSFYSFFNSSLRKAGPAIEVARGIDADLLHIIDKDLEKGVGKNLDIYDALTRMMYIQVEMPKIRFLKELYAMDVRVAFIPPNIPEAFNVKFSLLKTDNAADLGKYPGFRDILTSSESVMEKANSMKKRVFFLGNSKKAFCQITDFA
jgi:hypothetical protein